LVTIAAADLAHALQNPTPTTPFKQPGTDRMQAIKKLAAIFKEMAPQHAPTPRVDTPDQSIIPPTRVETVSTRKVTTSRVPATITPHPATTNDADYQLRRSPRDHSPPQVTQEERYTNYSPQRYPKLNQHML
jgi:hypothetical protein